jgi:hypothetical protein
LVKTAVLSNIVATLIPRYDINMEKFKRLIIELKKPVDFNYNVGEIQQRETHAKEQC